jgi:hypothetical protein
LQAAAQATLARLFTPAFIAALAAGQRSAANTGTRSYTSADGKFTNTVRGDGASRLATPVDAALALYELYAAAADMQAELVADFTRYLAPEQAVSTPRPPTPRPSTKRDPAWPKMATSTGAWRRRCWPTSSPRPTRHRSGASGHAAKLRFAHAEIVIPFASALGLPGMSEQLPRSTPYSYAASPWRGASVAPMAANIQWDVYQNASRTLVRMLYNERETDFKAAAPRQNRPASHFYDYSKLKRCYK